MKILHVVLSRGFYGSERYCGELAAEQAREGHDVEILIDDGWSDCAREMRKLIGRANHLGGGTLTLTAMPQWLPKFLHRPFARRVLRRFRPDVVHTHLNPAARRVGREAQRLGIPHVLTLHLGYDDNEHFGYSGLIALSDHQRQSVPEDFPGLTAVVWNWMSQTVADALAAATQDDVLALRQNWKAGKTTVVFGSIGRLMPEKGMDWLVRAFRLAFPEGTEDVRLVIVGEGERRAEVKALAAGDERIILTGWQQTIAPYYYSFDVFVSAARFEPFGLSIIEALGAGCPMIASRIYGTLEFVTDKRVRWATPDDDAELATELRNVAARGPERFVYDMSKFDVKRAAREIEAFYGALIRHEQGRTAAEASHAKP
jgi:glycosyltransferase involved in cell wall biosynthesis